MNIQEYLKEHFPHKVRKISKAKFTKGFQISFPDEWIERLALDKREKIEYYIVSNNDILLHLVDKKEEV